MFYLYIWFEDRGNKFSIEKNVDKYKECFFQHNFETFICVTLHSFIELNPSFTMRYWHPVEVE